MRSLQLEYTVSVCNPHSCKILSLGRFLTEDCNNWIVWESFIWMICLRSFHEHECHNLSSVIYVNWSQSCAPYPTLHIRYRTCSNHSQALLTHATFLTEIPVMPLIPGAHCLILYIASSSMLDSFTGNVLLQFLISLSPHRICCI